jgi:GntR family transcriptional regulator, transcriptional repressor for pyruvate dehydrogenase complex
VTTFSQEETVVDNQSSNWEPVQRLRAHEQVMAQIEKQILAGHLSVGDHLPNERDLSAALGVSRPSLRESLRVLEALGVVEIRRGGDGGAVLVGTPGHGFVNMLKLQVALGQFSHHDVLETRLALETWSCREAALRHTDEDLVELGAILDQMDAPDIEVSEFNRLDAAFHVRIAESTGNRLTAHLMQSMRIAINRQMIEAYAQLENWRDTAKTVRREHRTILDLLSQRDAEGSAKEVHAHITSFYDALGHSGDTQIA